MSETCEICKNEYRFQWSDTHGVAACIKCGLPYRIFHYEGEGTERKRVEKPPEIAIKLEWLPIAKKYWEETHSRTFPAAYDMGFLSGRDSYSGATNEDAAKWNDWLDAHKDEWPKEAEAA